MKQIQKKIDRQYILSDSSVNEYGFRLLTSGYQMEAFQKNPIGYYMHRREDGIVLKWEDLCVEEDKVLGRPVINLSNERGVQTCDEAENGFLNAASVGHIVVLEYSTEPELMLPGQTGPTITKWYNKECSLVDIPGNCNALTMLYDEQENELNLVDLQIISPVIKIMHQNLVKELSDLLKVDEPGDEKLLLSSVQNLVSALSTMKENIETLMNENETLQEKIGNLTSEQNRFEISGMLERAIEDKKLTIELKDRLAVDYANNPQALRSLLSAMPAYRSISELLKNKSQDKTEALWLWDDYEKNDPTGKKLKDLRANDPVRYKELFDLKFNQ